MSAPTVFPKDESVPSVIYNEEKAAYDLTLRLLDYGNEKIGMITGPTDSSHTVNRSRGHMKALFDRRVPYNPSLTVVGDWERDSGFLLSRELIEQGVTAVFAQNDLMAAGVLDYCSLHGITVGQDIQLIGFDNRDISSASRPRLSTVALPLFEIGQKSAREMLSILDGIPSDQHLIQLDCEIIERETTLNRIRKP